MAPRVKVSDFISSSARYARSSAERADAKKDGRLSKTDAKKLPADLQDDYQRQAKAKGKVGTKDFARDQAAFVAVATRRADKNKDGILSASEAATLPATLKDNEANFRAMLGGAGGGGAVEAFAGKGRGKAETDGGLKLTRLSLSPATDALVGSLGASGAGGYPCAAAWKGKPADVAAALAAPAAHKDFWTDVLFNGTGTSYRKDYPDYYVSTDTGIGSVAGAKVPAEISQFFFDALEATSAAAKPGIERDAAALAKSMNLGPDTKFISLHWDNQDDCWFNGLVAADPKSGQLRMVGNYDEP